jgi:hypothetical protein
MKKPDANSEKFRFQLSKDELGEGLLSDELRDEQIDEANAELASVDPTLDLEMLDLNTVELDEIAEIRRALRLRDSGLDDERLDGEL